MRIIQIERREDFNTQTIKFKIVFLGIPFYRTLLGEAVVFDKYPLWFRLSKWLLQKTCRHKWDKKGRPYMKSFILGDAPSQFWQEVKCSVCSKENRYTFTNEIYTD